MFLIFILQMLLYKIFLNFCLKILNVFKIFFKIYLNFLEIFLKILTFFIKFCLLFRIFD